MFPSSVQVPMECTYVFENDEIAQASCADLNFFVQSLQTLQHNADYIVERHPELEYEIKSYITRRGYEIWFRLNKRETIDYGKIKGLD